MEEAAAHGTPPAPDTALPLQSSCSDSNDAPAESIITNGEEGALGARLERAA